MFAFMLTVVLPDRLPAQQTQPVDIRQQVQETVETFLADLGSLNFEALESHLTPEMILIVARQTQDGMKTSTTTGKNWIAGVKKMKTPFEEPISNLHITVDSDVLAYLRADFTVVRNGNVLSHGVDQFTLIKEDGRWMIAAVAYTSIPGPPK